MSGVYKGRLFVCCIPYRLCKIFSHQFEKLLLAWDSKRHGSYYLESNWWVIQQSNPAFCSCCSKSLPISGVDSSARHRTSSGILNVRSFYSSLVLGNFLSTLSRVVHMCALRGDCIYLGGIQDSILTMDNLHSSQNSEGNLLMDMSALETWNWWTIFSLIAQWQGRFGLVLL